QSDDDTAMSAKPENWMQQADNMFKLWSAQQEKLFGPMFDPAGYMGLAGGRAAAMPGDAAEGLRQVQKTWQSSVDQWITIAQKAMPQAGMTAELLKALFD